MQRKLSNLKFRDEVFPQMPWTKARCSLPKVYPSAVHQMHLTGFAAAITKLHCRAHRRMSRGVLQVNQKVYIQKCWAAPPLAMICFATIELHFSKQAQLQNWLLLKMQWRQMQLRDATGKCKSWQPASGSSLLTWERELALCIWPADLKIGICSNMQQRCQMRFSDAAPEMQKKCKSSYCASFSLGLSLLWSAKVWLLLHRIV